MQANVFLYFLCVCLNDVAYLLYGESGWIPKARVKTWYIT